MKHGVTRIYCPSVQREEAGDESEVRTHVSLGKDAPCGRSVERFGDIVAFSEATGWPSSSFCGMTRPPTEAAYFAGLRTGLSMRGRLKSSSISAKLRSSCDAACIQVLAMSSNTWRCRSDLVSSAQRKHS